MLCQLSYTPIERSFCRIARADASIARAAGCVRRAGSIARRPSPVRAKPPMAAARQHAGAPSPKSLQRRHAERRRSRPGGLPAAVRRLDFASRCRQLPPRRLRQGGGRRDQHAHLPQLRTVGRRHRRPHRRDAGGRGERRLRRPSPRRSPSSRRNRKRRWPISTPPSPPGRKPRSPGCRAGRAAPTT